MNAGAWPLGEVRRREELVAELFIGPDAINWPVTPKLSVDAVQARLSWAATVAEADSPEGAVGGWVSGAGGVALAVLE